ncbi:MAG: class I SAM-dependent methyltransferase [Solirubrobacteraceae bacterium]
MTAAPDHSHPIFAHTYAFMSRFGREGLGRRRAALLAGLSGRVIEVGAGIGDNFEHYPLTVTEVVAVEPEPHLRKLATHAAARAPVAVSVHAGFAEALPFDDASFDVAVTSLVLCSVQSPSLALAELQRVIRPGGELRFFEHVRSHSRVLATLQEVMDRSHLWPAVAGGCHCARDTLSDIGDRFTVEQVHELNFIRPWTPVNPFLIGAARRAPAEAGMEIPADPR